jgi:hypothetical protein
MSNHYLHTFRDYSRFTISCDVDELLFAFGGTLNMLNRLQAANPKFAGVTAGYNWYFLALSYLWIFCNILIVPRSNYALYRWVRDNSTEAEFDGDKNGLYFGRLNRFYYDGGFGKHIYMPSRTWWADIHASSGEGGEWVNNQEKIRTNHHRHGAFSDKKFMKSMIDHNYQLPENAYGYNDVYKALVPCMVELKRRSDAGEWVSPKQAQEIAAPCLQEDNATVYSLVYRKA